MASRHQSRICVMQSLYELDMRPKAKILEIIRRNLKEREDSDLDKKYIKKTIEGVLKKVKEIDKIIEKSAPEWPLEQIARVDKNILRVAIFELKFSKKELKIPPKVAIDEAVEISKAFGGENSSKFVNGVLGTVYGKNKKAKSKDEKQKTKSETKSKI